MSIPKIHLICNAHLDPVWQWRWEEGCAETLATFRNAVQLLYEYPDFIFNHNEALLYRWVLKYDPDLLVAIQKLARAGRWSISGGWYLQPDVNLPGIESIIRQIIEGRRFFQDYFGVQPLVAYNFDSFGHSGGLPQILCQAGYKMYLHLRPQSPDLELPSDLYRWQGVDGSEIIGYRIAVGLYHTEYDNIEQRLAEGVELALRLNRDVPVFWGIGDHGGGATRADLVRIAQFQRQEKRVEIIPSTPDRFYEAVKDLAENAPLFQGDLQRIFTGCYTSLSRIKRGACRSLHRLVQTETLRTATWWLYGQEYPQLDLEEAWRDHLFNDFHDILPGSCTELAERDALDLYGRVGETVRRLRLGAAVAFNSRSQKDYQKPGRARHTNCVLNAPDPVLTSIPVTVMNTNPACTRAPVEVECMISHRPKWSGTWYLRLFNIEGTEIPCQEEGAEALLPFNGWRRKVSFIAKLPAVGVANYYLQLFEGERKIDQRQSALNLKFDYQQGLISNLDSGPGQECLAGPLMQPLVVEDEGDSWGTNYWTFRKILGKFQPEKDGVRIIETGPIRTIYQSIFTFNHSKLVMNTITYAHFPVLEYRLRIYWNEERKRLKLSIPTVFKNDHLICEVPGGVITRPADGEEHVHGRWSMLSGNLNGRDAALGVVNCGQHGLDYQDGEVRLSVLRSAAYCHEQGFKIENCPAPKFMDQGVHDMRLFVLPGDAEAVKKSLPGLAILLNAPPVSYAHLPIGSYGALNNFVELKLAQNSFQDLLAIDPENIILLACHRSRDGQALIVRLQESINRGTQARISFTIPPVQLTVSFQPLEIQTLRIEKSGQWARSLLCLYKNF